MSRRTIVASLLIHAVLLGGLLFWSWPAPEPDEEFVPIVTAQLDESGAAGASGGAAGGSDGGSPQTETSQPVADAPPEPVAQPAEPVPPPPKPRPKPVTSPRPRPPAPPPQRAEAPAIPQPAPEAVPPPEIAPPPLPQPAPETAYAPPPPAAQRGQVVASIHARPGSAAIGTANTGPGGVSAGIGRGPSGSGAGAFGTGQGPGDDYLDRLRRYLARHKKYPEEAHRKKQEGTVIVAFVLARDGTVLDSRIERSSGFPLIDQAVLDMMRRASPVPPLPPAYQGERLSIAMPVRFTIGFFERFRL